MWCAVLSSRSSCCWSRVRFGLTSVIGYTFVVEQSHGWDRIVNNCDGIVLVEEGVGGYGFEPLTPGPRACVDRSAIHRPQVVSWQEWTQTEPKGRSSNYWR